MKTKHLLSMLGILCILIPSVSYSQNANNCNTVANLGCGQSINSTTVGGGNDFTIADFNCHSSANQFNAEDKVYKISPTVTGTYEIRLSGLSKDLDIFLLRSSCSAGICIGKSTLSDNNNEKITANLKDDSTYYLVVDGYNAIQAGNFTLNLTCPQLDTCGQIETLVCGLVDTFSTLGKTSKYNKTNYDDCYQYNSSFSGGDIAFKYNHNANNPNAIVTIWGYNKDLDLFVLNSCSSSASCVKKAINRDYNTEYVDFTGLPYGNYYIVVDGYEASQVSQFKISVSCQKVCRDDSLFTKMDCDQTINGSTKNGKNNFSKYSIDEYYGFTGPEMYYSFRAPAADTYDIELWGFSNDLELFVLSRLNCKNNPTAIAKSTHTPGKPEWVRIVLKKDELIYIVVDGSLGSASNFSLKVNCPKPAPKLMYTISEEICDAKNKTVQIPVKVKNFKNVISFSMTIQSDNPAAVQLKKINSNVLNTISYNVFEDNKTITITYLANAMTTLADNTTAFTIEAILAGNVGQSSLIKIVNQPTPIKTAVVVDNQNVLAEVLTDNGSACINAPDPLAKLIFDIDDADCDFKSKSIVLPVKVRNFNKIRSFSMTVTADNASIFRIDTIMSPLNVSFSTFQFTAGKTFTLQMLNNTGLTLADGSIAFNVHGTLVGNPGQSTKVSIISNPTAIQAISLIDDQNAVVPVEVIDGSACIKEGSLIKLAGKVKERDNDGIKSVKVKLSGSATDEVTTTVTGLYEFDALLSTGNYSITAMRNDNAKNGIDILDLALLQDHIINRTVLTDPYKIVAADVYKDGVIDILDLAELQDLIIARITVYRNNTSWIFIPSDEIMTVAKALNRTYRTNYSIPANSASASNLDFFGIKVGDVDQNANGQNIALIESRGTGNFTLTLPSMKAKKEQLIYVPVILEKFEDVRVFQFSVKWDHTKLEYLKSESFNAELAGFNETNIRYNEDQAGVLNSLWLNTDNKSLASYSTLFNMVFKVKASEGDNIDLRLNEVKAMEVAGQIQATYTDGKITISDISTKIKNAAYTDMAIKLFPNPASDFIHISAPNTFDILEITNINGARQSLNYKSKTNYKLDMSSFPAGVYLLKTVSDGVVHTHKLVLSK